jgi:hypothetical protein
MLYRVHLAWAGFELTTLVLLGTDCIGSCKSNYHTTTTTTAHNYFHFIGFRFNNYLYAFDVIWPSEVNIVILVCVLGQFSIDFTYQSKNGTGTGQIVLEIDTVDHITVGLPLFSLILYVLHTVVMDIH